VQPVGPCGHLVRLDGKRKRVQHSVGQKVRQSIDVIDLTGIAHVPPMRALGQLMAQVRHRNVRTILLQQAVNPVLPASCPYSKLWLSGKLGDFPV
jgi:hypothetical protein